MNVYIAPQTSKRVELVSASHSQGAFIYLPLDLNYGPTPMTLRSRDLSKTAESFGTEVPIVRDSDFAQFVVITDVPTYARYRATLRIYNSSEAPRVRASGERVRIEIEDPIRHIVSPPPPPIWALVSVTNNVTQQVTTITPHP